MINFRYHVVSLTAALLALAVGVVLGAGFLSPDGQEDTATAATTDAGVVAFDDGYAAGTGPALVKGALDKERVVIVTTPGAQSEDVKGVQTALEAAGATVSGRVDLTAKVLDAGNRQFADGVAEQAGAQVTEVSSAAPGFVRVGAGIGRAFLSKTDATIDEAATQLSAAFVEGDLITVDTAPQQRATLAVVVTGPRTAGSSQQGASLAGIATGLDALGKGVVVAGPASTSFDDGLIDGVRSDSGAAQVSTVDVVDTAGGRFVVALAAAQEVAGRSGQWGTSRSSDGAVPTS